MSDKHVGEVVQSSISQWTVQAWQWDCVPEFGSVVCLESDGRQIFGVVHYIKTGPEDERVRQVFAYQKTEIELRREQPQIFEFLKTQFSCLPLGYLVDGSHIYALPSQPPRIHAFVRLATPAELTGLFRNEGVVHVLFGQSAKIDYFEELILAILRYLQPFGLVNRSLLLQLTSSLALIMANDYRRLKLFMDRLGTIALITQ